MRHQRNSFGLFVLTLFCFSLSGQKDNIVWDKKLYDDLYNFIIPRLNVIVKDGNGKIIPLTDEYDKGTGITSRNLRTDSILADKSIIGLYATRIACWDCGSDYELYFQYKDKREFININDKNLKPFDIINMIERFFEANPNEFSEIEKIRTLRNAMQVLESRTIHSFDK